MIKAKQIQRPQLLLVVDDQEINRDALGVILEDHYEVIYACNGREALEMVEKHLEDLSLIMLDIMMPEMDGFEVMEYLNRDERMKKIPVVVLTADKNAELKALKMGASDFITKPFDMHEVILARIERIIELSEGRQLISAAEQDPLTGLYSKNFFMEYANRIFLYHPEIHMDAIAINVEQFHTVNALNGREFGDAVLSALGEEIRDFLSSIKGIASRLEADRFDIYCEPQEDYGILLSRLQSRVNKISRGASIHLRMGIRQWIQGVEPLMMFDGARAACNMVRGDYQKPMMIYDENMRMRELLDQRLLNDLTVAVEDRQLMVYYQPKYDIQSDPPRLVSAEALIRWKHPELGMTSPGDFVPLFESKGMISVIDSYVWNEAARQVASWRDKYNFTLPVSVNLSRANVFDPLLVEKLVKIVEDNKLDFKNIKLEVTESAYTDNARQLIDVINRLRGCGFEIEMDDFGSGYSSLNMLSSMPIDVLKMDMKFIRNIETNETDRRLVNLVLDMAKYLDVPVVAEGVETEGQLELLRNANCDLVQGFYFSRPLPPEEFEKLIQREMEIERDKK